MPDTGSKEKMSYTAADTLPGKLISDPYYVERIAGEHHIPPVHTQLIPTNKCNLNCEFCSCENEDRTLEMDPEDIDKLVWGLHTRGCEAVTITGGGEPLMYPHLKYLLRECRGANIGIGLVTNGVLLDNLQVEPLWCRISVSDKTGPNLKAVERAMDRFPDVAWAFSYVLSPEPNMKKIQKYVKLVTADKRFTHLRIVSDILDFDNIPAIDIGDNPKVLVQDRKAPRQGGDCYVHWLRPVIGPDLKVYTCCGAQYALDPPSLKMPEELCLGHFDDWIKLNERCAPFDGSICKRCYYTSYNQVLSAMLADVEHRSFV